MAAFDSEMRAVACVCVFLGACQAMSRPSPSSPPHDDVGTAGQARTSSSTGAGALADRDFQGSFNGARVFGTLRVAGSAVEGTLFHQQSGVDIPVKGALRNGVLTLRELERGRSDRTVTLRSNGNIWSGSWKNGRRRGNAWIAFLQRRPGEPVVVATRTHRTTSSPCEGQVSDGGTRKVRAVTTVRIPVVLGLANRTFERELDARLQADAEQFQAMTCPVGVDVSFRVVLNTRGFFSVIFDERNVAGPGICVACETFHENDAAGLTAAVDAGFIAHMRDFVDPDRLGAALPHGMRDATEQCVAGDQQPVDPVTLLDAFVLTARGADYCYRWCVNHMSGSRCGRISYQRLRPALEPGSLFAPLWAH